MSLEKKNKVKHARLMRSVKDQLEKLVHILSHLVYLSVHLLVRGVSVSQLSTRAGMLEQARNELYVEMDILMTHITGILAGPAERTVPRSTRQVMHKIWMRSAPSGWLWLNDGRH